MLTAISAKILAALMLAAQLTGACATTAPSANVYTLDGIYCVDTVYTDDGNCRSYDMVDCVGDVPAYDGMPVTVWLSDNGTPDCVTDDVILALSPASSNI